MKPLSFTRTGVALGVAGLLGAAVVATAQPGPAEQLTPNPMVMAGDATHIATLTGADEVPPVETTGTGTAWILFDQAANTLTWTIEFDGLTGPGTAAHFHGPAASGETADPVLPIAEADPAIPNPMEGTATLTAEQAEQLNGGLWYVNIHTEANPGGEIRGQVLLLEE
jgi:hypothetical protein